MVSHRCSDSIVGYHERNGRSIDVLAVVRSRLAADNGTPINPSNKRKRSYRYRLLIFPIDFVSESRTSWILVDTH
jgi:hypothetical protein